jgi:ankyrin repeat protein
LETPLHQAARAGHLEVVQLLLQHSHHSEHHCRNLWGQSPLQLAALHGRWDVAQSLLDHEEMQKLQGPTKVVQQKLRTPLEILKSLLEHADFGNVNLFDRYGDGGILHAAIRKGAPECIQYLVCHENIDINLRGSRNRTPLALAAVLGQADTIKLLLQHKNIDVERRGYGGSALELATDRGHGEIVDLLLAHGAKDPDSNAPSHGSIHTIADDTTIIHPQLKSFTNQDLQACSYNSVNEWLDADFWSVECDCEKLTGHTAWFDGTIGTRV